jgi:hypothetical protein
MESIRKKEIAGVPLAESSKSRRGVNDFTME